MAKNVFNCEFFFTVFPKKRFLFLLYVLKLGLVPSERGLIHCGYSDGKPGVPVEEYITANIMQNAKNRLLTSSTRITGTLQILKRSRIENLFIVGLNRA